jgi:hypothetical protein
VNKITKVEYPIPQNVVQVYLKNQMTGTEFWRTHRWDEHVTTEEPFEIKIGDTGKIRVELALHPVPGPTPTPTPAPGASIPALADRFELVKLTTFDGVSLPPDFYRYERSRGNKGDGWRDPGQGAVRDGLLVITAKGDVSGAVRQNVKQQYGF